MGHGCLRAWLIALARPDCRRRRARLTGLLWVRGSGSQAERAFLGVSATSRPPYADAQNFRHCKGSERFVAGTWSPVQKIREGTGVPSPSRFSRGVESTEVGEIVLRSVGQMVSDWNHDPLPLCYASPISAGPRNIHSKKMERFIVCKGVIVLR